MEKKQAPRKMKFAPRGPPKPRVPKPEVKSEPVEDDNTTQAANLLRRFNEGSLRKPKAEKKVPASQVAWMGGVVNSTRSYLLPNGSSSGSRDGVYGSSSVEDREYKEPWDYYSNYPITLPLRRPYSGNPEVLDMEEFGQASETETCRENSINAAAELGLMEDNGEPRMLFMQLPTVPMPKQASTSKTKSNVQTCAEEKACILKELPGGFMGKLLVYRSGKVKLKLGDMLYDVSPGLKCEYAQDVMTINTTEKDCCLIGEVNKHAIVTPDLDSILNSINDI